MFSKHVTRDLSAYCHGELSPQDSRAIAEHLIGCQQCRAEFEEIKLGVKFAEHLPEIAAPDSLWNDLEVLLDAPLNAKAGEHKTAHDRPRRFGTGIWQPRFAAIAATLILAVGLGAYWLYERESRPSWEVARLDGSPLIGSAKMNDKSRLAVGQWLVTDNVSRAKIQVGSI